MRTQMNLCIPLSQALYHDYSSHSRICQWPSWRPAFVYHGELGLITSCLFSVIVNYAPSSSSVSWIILDNTSEGKWPEGRGYRGIWISQEIYSCNLLKRLWTIPVTPWFLLPYWLAHQCLSLPLSPPHHSFFHMLPLSLSFLCYLSLFLMLPTSLSHAAYLSFLPYPLSLKLENFCTFLQSPFINKGKKIKSNSNPCFISLFSLSSLTWILSIWKCLPWHPYQFLINWP